VKSIIGSNLDAPAYQAQRGKTAARPNNSCPNCGQLSTQVHRYYQRQPADLSSYKLIWMSGWNSAIGSDPTPANIVMARCRCKHFKTPNLWLNRNNLTGSFNRLNLTRHSRMDTSIRWSPGSC